MTSRFLSKSRAILGNIAFGTTFSTFGIFTINGGRERYHELNDEKDKKERGIYNSFFKSIEDITHRNVRIPLDVIVSGITQAMTVTTLTLAFPLINCGSAIYDWTQEKDSDVFLDFMRQVIIEEDQERFEKQQRKHQKKVAENKEKMKNLTITQKPVVTNYTTLKIVDNNSYNNSFENNN